MSDRLRLILVIIVCVYAVIAVRMIHRKKLSLNYSLLWLLLAVLMMAAVIFPGAVYALSDMMDVEIPFNMLLLFFCFFALVLLFYLTSIVSKDNEKNRKLTQQIALLEKRIRELEKQVNNTEGPSE